MFLPPSVTDRPSQPSLWQSLEAKAANAKFTWRQLMKRLTASGPEKPVGKAQHVDTTYSGSKSVSSPSIDSNSFERWSALTDEYAQAFLLMQRGDAHARIKARRLAVEMMQMNQEMTCNA